VPRWTNLKGSGGGGSRDLIKSFNGRLSGGARNEGKPIEKKHEGKGRSGKTRSKTGLKQNKCLEGKRNQTNSVEQRHTPLLDRRAAKGRLKPRRNGDKGFVDREPWEKWQEEREPFQIHQI